MFIYIEKNAGYSNSPRIWQPRKVIYDNQSEFQHITVLDTNEYGEALFLDGVIQSAQADEGIYHTWLVHPAMYIKNLIHKQGKKTHLWNVLVIGGGEGCTAREVMHWYRVGDVTQLDIDGELVQLYRERLAHWNGGIYSHPNMHVEIKDAVDWARKISPAAEEKRDVVVLDLTEPAEFGEDWDTLLRAACMVLREDGVLVGYMGTIPEKYDVEKSVEWSQFCAALAGSFTTSKWNPIYYKVYMPSWGGYSLFFGASRVDKSIWKFNWDIDDILTNMRNCNMREYKRW